MAPDAIFEGLNSEQRRAVEAVRGPVCILAGAGSGKTTTITRRIAHQVATRAFRADEILAVTFTDKAAAEMRARLAALGADGVEARTFHSAALGQLRRFGDEPRDILPSKALLLRQIANALPVPYRFRPAGDLATEIERAKNRRLTPATYRGSLDGHRPPIPPDLMERVFREYERRKDAQGRIDFEDVLELAIRMYDDDQWALAQLRERYRAFTVDEYQDVNLLQQSLLERWLGNGDDLCVVGDDYQAIYSFIGATPRHLLSMPSRFPEATVVRLEANYRSTPEILALANRLVPGLGGAEKVLRATRATAVNPVLSVFDDPADEAVFVAERVRELGRDGVPYEDMAVLYRTNDRSEDYEEALSRAGIPFRVRDGAFLARYAARRVRARLAGVETNRVAAATREAALAEGFAPVPPEGLGAQETVRQNDLARLVRLAEDFDDGERTAADFLAELDARFGSKAEGRGVNLLTYHAAKGLEFEAVFLPRLTEWELPGRQARSPEAVAEERRLLYVGITRTKRHLFLSRPRGKPSRFLAELGLVPRAEKREERAESAAAGPPDPAVVALKAWRRERAKADGLAAFLVLHDKTLEEIARRGPTSASELAAVPGIGPMKLERYGADVLVALAAVR